MTVAQSGYSCEHYRRPPIRRADGRSYALCYTLITGRWSLRVDKFLFEPLEKGVVRETQRVSMNSSAAVPNVQSVSHRAEVYNVPEQGSWMPDTGLCCS
nr:hypothetical protein CFP56_75789 [Quercus suber]